jgi:hypothetical protein
VSSKNQSACRRQYLNPVFTLPNVDGMFQSAVEKRELVVDISRNMRVLVELFSVVPGKKFPSCMLVAETDRMLRGNFVRVSVRFDNVGQISHHQELDLVVQVLASLLFNWWNDFINDLLHQTPCTGLEINLKFLSPQLLQCFLL